MYIYIYVYAERNHLHTSSDNPTRVQTSYRCLWVPPSLGLEMMAKTQGTGCSDSASPNPPTLPHRRACTTAAVEKPKLASASTSHLQMTACSSEGVYFVYAMYVCMYDMSCVYACMLCMHECMHVHTKPDASTSASDL